VSLNGDLNWRFFEIIASGGFLLTDRLNPDSGVDRLFEEGTHYEAFSNSDELVQKINFYREHPDAACRIARQGFQRYWENFSPTHLRKEALNRLFMEKRNALYDCNGVQPNKNSPGELRAYQCIQEIHRSNLSLDLWHYKDVSLSRFIEKLRDYSRVTYHSCSVQDLEDAAGIDLISTTSEASTLLVVDLRRCYAISQFLARVRPKYIVSLAADYPLASMHESTFFELFAYNEEIDCLTRLD